MTALSRLESLLAAASMRPWKREHWMLAEGSRITCARDGEFVGHCERDLDAQVIVAAVNALPALLRVARAAEDYLNSDPVDACEEHPAERRLRDAIRAMNGDGDGG